MRWRVGLAGKLVAIMTLFAALVVTGLGSYAFLAGRTALIESTLARLHSETLEKEVALRTWIEERRSDMLSAARHFQSVGIETVIETGGPLRGADRMTASGSNELLFWLDHQSKFSSLFILEPDSGEVLLSTDSNDVGRFKENRAYFQEGRHRTLVHGPFYSVTLQAPAIVASAPLLDQKGNLVAVLAGRIDVEELNKIVALRSGLQRSDDAYLINASRLFVTQPRLVDDPSVLQRGIRTSGVDRCLSGVSNSEIGLDFQGVPVIAVYRWLDSLELCLVGLISQEEAFEPIRALRITLVAGGVFALLLAAFAVIVLVRTITRPINRLQSGTAAVADGNFDTQLPERGDDELGRLIKNFNAMTRALKSRSQALRASDERFRSTFEQAAMGMSHVGLDGSWLRVNRKFSELVGYSQEELLEKKFGEITHPDDQAENQALFDHAVRAEFSDYEMEKRYIRKDGSSIWVNFIVALVRDVSGEPEYFLTVVEDIGERKKAQAEIQTLNESLEARVEQRTAELRKAQSELLRKERLATLGQLTATVSHELRNPLAAMRTSTHILFKKMSDQGSAMTRAVERLDRSITRCDHIIDELLDFTRAIELDLVPVELDDWLAELLDELAVPDGVVVERVLALAGRRVTIDSDRMRRVVINIYENACQAITSEGDGASGRVRVSTRDHGGQIEIAFEDNGSGIPADILPRIFEPLFSTKNFGVGLGLPIVKQIAEQHGGGVRIAGAEGGGTVFTIWLPRQGQNGSLADDEAENLALVT